MDIWNDGRSGIAGCFAGNIALAAISSGEHDIEKLKGTTFSTPRELIIGRVCASDGYLGGSVLHWANVSWDQHCDLEREARSQKKQLLYLFVTASGDPSGIHYWRVPGSIVRLAIEQRERNHRGATAAVHILASGERNLLGTTDISAMRSSVALSDLQARSLSQMLKDRATSAVRGASNSVRKQSVPEPVLKSTDGNFPQRSMTAFDIPIAGARSVRLSIPLPLASADLARLKGWIDLMADVLTEESTPEIEEARANEKQWLREQVEAGVRQLERGEKVDGEAAFDRILKRRPARHAAAR